MPDDTNESKNEQVETLRIEHSATNGQATVVVAGDIDLSTVSRLRKDLEGICSAPATPKSLTIDLRNVAFIDSAGLALFVEIRNRFGAVCSLHLLIRSGSQPERVLRLGQFERFIPIERDGAPTAD